MAQISEGPQNPTQLLGALRDGIETLNLGQEVTFQAYTRVVLPIDGYVFWLPTTTTVIKGSLHYSQEIQQNEDETIGSSTVLFTSEEKITLFSDAPTNTIYVACVDNFRYAFSQQQGFYTQVGAWHYFGRNIQPAMASQLLDKPGAIDPSRAITSNSLALWLSLNSYIATYADWFSNTVALYPSKLVEPNLVPPYGVVHIPEDTGTRALQSVPHLDINRNHTQLVSDRVQITLFGLQNNEAMDFVDCVMQYSINTDNFGIMNMPVINDAKRSQAEIETIAMKKTVEFEISYLQSRAASVARQLILSAVPTYYISNAVI